MGELKDGKVVAFPDEEWNAWRNAKKDEIDPNDHWVCVQSVVADMPATCGCSIPPRRRQAHLLPDGPSWSQIDLTTDKRAQVIAFDEEAAPQGSYLNDVRFSTDGNYGLHHGFRRGRRAARGRSRDRQGARVLDGDPSTMPDRKA